ncbi:exosome complex RNA-binding protein Csl4 [Methanobrevibacter filiformis]|nr:exosome complex RNA-binding protein Csl4 [Methanobrevibacter filiformis]
MSSKTGDFVIPGEILGVSEQFLPDEGTYDDEGQIKSSIFGNVSINKSNRKVSIVPKSNTPMLLEVGDIIYGQINDVRGQRAKVEIQKLKGSNRQLALPYMGAIHISQVKKGYLEKLIDAFRIGDIIEAKITKIVGDNVDLSTASKDLGVLKAMCTKCRVYMIQTKRKGELYCEVCDRKEKRLISSNYLL